MNENTYFIESADEIDLSVLTKDIRSIGICGATSTPKWLMEDISMFIKEKIKELEN